MATDCGYFPETLCKNTSDDMTYYADFTDIITNMPGSVTLSAVTVTCPDDDALTLANASVLGSETTVPRQFGTRTIAASHGVKFDISGGTAIGLDDLPVEVHVAVTLSTGKNLKKLAKLRVVE